MGGLVVFLWYLLSYFVRGRLGVRFFVIVRVIRKVFGIYFFWFLGFDLVFGMEGEVINI